MSNSESGMLVICGGQHVKRPRETLRTTPSQGWAGVA